MIWLTRTALAVALLCLGASVGAEGGAPLDETVKVSVRRAAGPEAYVVVLEIDSAWHVNANPSSNRFLIPTSVTLEGGELDAVQYPEGHALVTRFSDTTLSVYDGTVEIPIALSAKPPAGGRSLLVRYQACTEERCAAPKRVVLSVPGL